MAWISTDPGATEAALSTIGWAASVLGGAGLGLGALWGAVVGWRPRGDRSDVTDPESADQAVDAELHRLARGLSHDLSGPLRSLSVALDMVEEDLESGHTEDAHETLAVVRMQAEQLARMTADLVGYCRTAWRPQLVEPTSLSAVVEAVVGAVEVPKAVDLQLHIVDAQVQVQAEALSTVLRLVLENALRHRGRPEGVVRVTASVEPGPQAGWLSISVDDDGQGIPSEMHDAVFAIFRRSTSVAEGSGVGLSLAQTLTWRAGGHIGIKQSDLGGACVQLRWPLQPSEGLP